MTIILEAIPYSIIEEQNRKLVKEFTPGELRLVGKNIHPKEVPKPDGMQTLFTKNTGAYLVQRRLGYASGFSMIKVACLNLVKHSFHNP